MSDAETVPVKDWTPAAGQFQAVAEFRHNDESWRAVVMIPIINTDRGPSELEIEVVLESFKRSLLRRYGHRD